MKTKVEYYEYIAKLPKGIKSKFKYDAEAPDGVLCDTSFFKDAADMYEGNPEFRGSLVVGLLKATISRTKGKGNTNMDETVINFYRCVAIYNPQAVMIVSANL